MAANDVNISDLTFDGIKQSLIDYLKTQDTFTDYDFEGSAIRTLVDLLAYNTFYYGYYANMMANEMFLDTAKLTSSLISLTKPLGYLVSDYQSAKISIKLNNINYANQISPFSIFRGTDVSGKQYFFYNVDSINVLQSGTSNYQTDYFDVYESKSSIFRQLISIDSNTQSFIIPNKEIDPNTIKIDVRYSGQGPYVPWKSYLENPDVVLSSNTEIFFIERVRNGYKINFGKNTSSDISSVGKTIQSTDTVYVSYLVSSGNLGNNISNLTFISDSLDQNIKKSNTQLLIVSPSSGGRSEPNLDQIRFFAPKTFARQNRLVTKNDYYAIMNELGYGTSENPDFSFKIFGGDEATPPVYGRVFVSIIGISPTDRIQEINQILSTLKDKSVVSILPEYLEPTEVSVFINAAFELENSNEVSVSQRALNSAQAALAFQYSQKKYNRNINKLDVMTLIKNSSSGIDLFPQDVSISYSLNIAPISESLGSFGRRISVKNKLSSVEISGANTNYIAKTSPDTGKHLYLYDGNTIVPGDPIGEVYFDEGIIFIYPQITSNSLKIFIKTPNDSFVSKDQLVTFVNNPNTDIKLTIREA